MALRIGFRILQLSDGVVMSGCICISGNIGSQGKAHLRYIHALDRRSKVHLYTVLIDISEKPGD